MSPAAPPPSTSRSIVPAYDELIFSPLIRSYYAPSRAYNTGLWNGQTRNQAEASRRLIVEMLSRVKGPVQKVLDVACGLGETTRLIAERWPGAQLSAINFSPAQIEQCRSLPLQCNWQVMDAAKLAFPDASFDAVVCIEAALHFHTREAFFRECLRVLRPGGQLVLTDILLADTRTLQRWHIPAENHLESLEAYRDLLLDTGFQDVAVEDQREACWGAFCDGVARWIDDPANPFGSSDEASAWRNNREALRAVVRHYLLAAAVKPA